MATSLFDAKGTGDAKGAGDAQVNALLKKYDINGDGRYGPDEARQMMRDIVATRKELTESKESRARLMKLMFAILGLLLLSMVGNCGMTFLVVWTLKDTHVQGGALTSNDGETVMTQTERPSILPTAHPVGRRRLRTIAKADGRRLQATEVGTLAKQSCEASYSGARATNDFSGYIFEATSGLVAFGEIISIPADEDLIEVKSTVAGQVVEYTVNRAGSADCQILELSSSGRQLRQVTGEEVAAWRRRRRLAVVDVEPDAHTFEHFPTCWIYHCFEGDEGCDMPSAREHCLIWDADNTTCLEPECHLAHDEADMKRDGPMWAALKNSFGSACGLLSACRVR